MHSKLFEYLSSINIHKIDKWVEKIISYPGINPADLQLRKGYWIATVAVLLAVSLLTIVFHIIYPEFKVIISYGYFIIVISAEYLAASFILKKGLNKLMFINQITMIIVTFITILRLGGIPYSGGLIFVGFFVVLFSLDFKQKKNSVWLFVIYIATLIMAGILDPYLTTAPEMTPAANIFLYVVNLAWISAFAFLFVLNFVSRRVEIEHREAECLKEWDEAKTKFYTDITHEFRTPLTVIRGMADLVRNQPVEWLHKGTRKIEDNSDTLLHLVNQMLNLSKLEAGAMPVHMVQGNAVIYIRYLIESLHSVSDAKNITLRYRHSGNAAIMDYDAEKLMQIIMNLVSNALKYTPPGGTVEITSKIISEEQKKFELRVKDTGIGIKKNNLPHIFDRFYRIKSGNTPYPGAAGTGLGLALTMELTKLLHATINAKSTWGKGTEFIISFPVTNNAPMVTADKLPEITCEIPSFKNIRKDKRPVIAKKDNKKPSLLIVEDSNDVIDYLLVLLTKDFRIILASNGKEGWEKAIQKIPDIILSDIMMPEMDGIELLDKLKNDIRTSHIPVVILSARADITSRLAGLDRGADAYIAKPFNKDELKIRLNRLITLRKKLHDRYSDMGINISSNDKNFKTEDTFILKIREFMLKNIVDGELNISNLCYSVAMGRSQLYAKFKSVTNRTIFEYFQSLRLHKAKELLLNSNTNVSEAAFRTGFKNLSHFSKVFNKEFGVNPSKILDLNLPS